MEEQKNHGHECHCGNHGEKKCCNCLDKPWMRILILFAAALVVFLLGVCTASKTLQPGEGRSCNQNSECPMRQAK